jgi:putative OPT family oligopeptide transporter
LKGFGTTGGSTLRTERDMPMTIVLGGSLALAVFLAVMPGLPTQGNILVSILVVLFGFFFATVSSRITGLIGSSSNPISGMTIATLIITCVIFVALGWTGDAYGPVALAVGAIVCICAANAGNTSQDLKTGYIVGATPIYQQIGLAIGVVTSAFVIGMTVLYMHRVFGIGSQAVAAPQATLMATLIKGLLSQNLPWGLVLVGVFISVTLELCGVHSLSFAVGAYLPIETTAPIFLGGLVRWWVERKTGEKSESDLGAGTLFSSGLIAGGSLAGILFAVLVGAEQSGYAILPALQSVGNAVPMLRDGTAGQIVGAVFFFVLAMILSRFAQRKV